MSRTNISINGIATLASGFASRQVLAGYVDGYRDTMGYFDWLETRDGGEEITGVPVFDQLTEDTVQSVGLAVGNSDAGTGGANVTVVFNGTASVPRVGEIIMHANGVTSYVWSVAANSANWNVVLKPIGSGVNIPAIAGGAQIVILSNAGGEGGESVGTVRRPALTKNQNHIQTFESGYEITDLGGGTKVEIPYNGKYFILDKDLAQQLLIHRMQVANQKLFGVKDSYVNAKGEMVYFTEGIRTTAKTRGFNGQTTGAGVFNIITDGKAIALLMDAARCGSEYMALAGQTAHLEIDVNAATNSAFSGGGISYAAYNGSKDISLAYGVKSLMFGGYTLHIQRFKTLEHKGLTGATGYEAFKKEILLLPTDKAMVIGGASIPRVRNRFMSFNGNKSLKYLEIDGGGLSERKTNSKRVFRRDIYSQEGCEVVDAGKLGVFNIQ
jgi:hypothetical protein